MSDLEDDPFLAAIMHLSTTKMDFPPSIAEIREQTLNLMHGELEAPSAIDAWERIWARIKGDEAIPVNTNLGVDMAYKQRENHDYQVIIPLHMDYQKNI